MKPLRPIQSQRHAAMAARENEFIAVETLMPKLVPPGTLISGEWATEVLAHAEHHSPGTVGATYAYLAANDLEAARATFARALETLRGVDPHLVTLKLESPEQLARIFAANRGARKPSKDDEYWAAERWHSPEGRRTAVEIMTNLDTKGRVK